MDTHDIQVSLKAIGDAATAAIDAAAQSLQRFADSIDQSVKESEQRLAQRFADQQGSPVNRVEWLDGGDGDLMWVVTLANRHKLVGMGRGLLDALADAERALAEYPPS